MPFAHFRRHRIPDVSPILRARRLRITAREIGYEVHDALLEHRLASGRDWKGINASCDWRGLGKVFQTDAAGDSPRGQIHPLPFEKLPCVW
jgi:hypothetical protein